MLPFHLPTTTIFVKGQAGKTFASLGTSEGKYQQFSLLYSYTYRARHRDRH